MGLCHYSLLRWVHFKASFRELTHQREAQQTGVEQRSSSPGAQTQSDSTSSHFYNSLMKLSCRMVLTTLVTQTLSLEVVGSPPFAS